MKGEIPMLLAERWENALAETRPVEWSMAMDATPVIRTYACPAKRNIRLALIYSKGRTGLL